jgi:hypothetical protein
MVSKPRAWNQKPMLEALRLQALGKKKENLPWANGIFLKQGVW